MLVARRRLYLFLEGSVGNGAIIILFREGRRDSKQSLAGMACHCRYHSHGDYWCIISQVV